MLRGAGEPDVGCWPRITVEASPSQLLRPARASPGGSRDRRRGALVSGGAVVLVDEPAQYIDLLDGARAGRNLIGHGGDFETEPAVRAGAVVVLGVRG